MTFTSIVMLILLAIVSSSAAEHMNETVACATNTTGNATMSPEATAMACGAITYAQFETMFNETSSNVTEENFIALLAACSVAGIEDADSMTFNQMAFFLGSVASNTDNLESHVSWAERTNDTDDEVLQTKYSPRGVMMLYGEDQYAKFQAYSEALGSPFNVTETPEIIGENLFMSYLSGLFVMLQPSYTSMNCMSLTADLKYDQCISLINDKECSAGNPFQMQRLAAIEQASEVLGNRFSECRMTQFECSASPKPSCFPIANATSTTSPVPTTPVPTTSSPVSGLADAISTSSPIPTGIDALNEIAGSINVTAIAEEADVAGVNGATSIAIANWSIAFVTIALALIAL